MAMFTISLLLCAAFALSGAAEDTTVMENHMEQSSPAEVVKAERWSRDSCPPGWLKYGARCFMFVRSGKTWMNAERYCVHFGANLASIHSSEEYHFVQELIILQTEDFTPAWIGGFDAVQNRVWLWSDGSRFDYRNWVTGEPNNSGGREPCMMMNNGGEKRWNDIQCESIFPSVCSKRLC
ncbi:ladderlectin [Salmo salar]|uniref:Ladderlectin n=1 Tax=Salmo salar TaxID=8030 RepID=A0A1S3M3S9_SALSA|nr:ladderlectin [Salmo salar]|eukprot:XP_013997666.1 PREDICTED: ladderlectin-like [Salmo salar]